MLENGNCYEENFVGEGDKKCQRRWRRLAILSKVVWGALQEMMACAHLIEETGKPGRDLRKEHFRKRD